MGIFTPDLNSLREVYISKLQHALNSERQIVEKGLPTMIEKATNLTLQQAFRKHLEESRQHVMRLEQILNDLEGEGGDKKCKVTTALLSAAESAIGDAGNEGIRDVILIAAGNEIEHHEIAIYGTLRTWAEVLGERAHAALLEATLEEEQAADELLSGLAEEINIEVPAV